MTWRTVAGGARTTVVLAWLCVLGAGLAASGVAVFGASVGTQGTTGGGGASARGSARLQEQLTELELQLGFLGQRVEAANSRIRSLERQVARRREDIERLQGELTGHEQAKASLASEAARLESEVEAIDRRCRELRERFTRWLLLLHKVRQGTLVTTLFSSRDLNSFMGRYQMIRYLLRHDHLLLEEMLQLEHVLFERQEELGRRHHELATLAERANAGRQRLEQQIGGLVGLIRTLVLERKVFTQKQKALQADFAALEQQIAAVENRRAQDPDSFEAGLRRPATRTDPAGLGDGTPGAPGSPVRPPRIQTGAATRTGAAAGTVTGDDPGRDPGGQSRTGGGAWSPTATGVWPAGQTGQASSIGTSGGADGGTPGAAGSALPVSPRDRLRFRWPLASLAPMGFNGGDNPGPMGMPVVGDGQVFATERGRVVFRGPMGRLGNVVIIAHQSGYTSVYGHLDDIWTGMGQIVERGEAIGRIAPGPRSSLHFEIRLAGKAEAPLALLPRLNRPRQP